ncbi:MAG: FtsX-like permease family protein [Chitinophagia bacterium]|nr:FtsX-like permease family protein [Chitinophagia bacterium]
MNNLLHILSSGFLQALQELQVNKLRTFLSLIGITIGIFCIISVLTVLDSAKTSIKSNLSELGGDVLYFGRWPSFNDDTGEFKWWEYMMRPSLTLMDANAVNSQLHNVATTCISLPIKNATIKNREQQISNSGIYAVSAGFEKVQKVDIVLGRFLNQAELMGGHNVAVIGNEVYNTLFPTGINPLGKNISVNGKNFIVVGTLKKAGGFNPAGFDLDNGIIISYVAAMGMVNVRSLEYNPYMIVKAHSEKNVAQVEDEARGILRRIHHIKPTKGDDFGVRKLSGLSAILDRTFNTFNAIGLFISFFSLLVGAFGIANIMFVTVRDRTKQIGLKKAIGARGSSILLEFLIEATVLCLVGGLTGISLVVILFKAAGSSMGMEVSMSGGNFMFGICVSVLVGLLSGFIPALRAARLDAAVAIRTH